MNRIAFTIGVGLALAVGSARAIVLDNGIPAGTVGHFSADIQSGGTASSVQYTALLPTNVVATRSLVFQYSAYVDNTAEDGGGFLLFGTAPALDGFGGVTSPSFSTGGADRPAGRMKWTPRPTGLHYKWVR